MEKFHAEIAADVQEKEGEKLQDLVFMLQAIAQERTKRLGATITDHLLVSLMAGCPRPHPGKPPEYATSVRQFRLRYIGIAERPDLQADFRSRLLSPLLETPTGDMTNPRYFWQVNNLFLLGERGLEAKASA